MIYVNYIPIKLGEKRKVKKKKTQQKQKKEQKRRKERKSDPQTSSLHITWKLVRNLESHAAPDPRNQICILTRFLDDLVAC